jgi:hypothetical protein
MPTLAIANTSSGVERVSVLDKDALDSLACWLCSDKEYHYPVEKLQTRSVNDHEFERQVKHNGGYCNICRDCAGEILSHFDLVKKEADHAATL